MPDENWSLSDDVGADDAYLLAWTKPLGDGLHAVDAPVWALAWPFAEGVTADENTVWGLVFADEVGADDAYLIAWAKPLSDNLQAVDAFTWKIGVLLADNAGAADAITVFERVMWKLTLGRWGDTQRPRAVIEGVQVQGAGETIRYYLDITQWCAWPTVGGAQITDSSGTDVTATCMSGDCYLVDAVTIAVPYIHDLLAGEDYRVTIAFSEPGHIYTAFFTIRGEA